MNIILVWGGGWGQPEDKLNFIQTGNMERKWKRKGLEQRTFTMPHLFLHLLHVYFFHRDFDSICPKPVLRERQFLLA